jgi:DNA mismatch endonuclease (patch repair protein)
MADILTKAERSAFMARIRSKDTRPELIVRKTLHRLGYRFRVHFKGLAGRPDVAFPGRKKAIFVHGCFWHQHSGCSFSHLPKTRTEYWRDKFARNCARDLENVLAANKRGWSTYTIWECELTKEEALIDGIRKFLGPTSVRS